MERVVLLRHSAPNLFDHAPYGTLCEVRYEGKRELYIQNSKDDANPKWIEVKSETPKTNRSVLGDGV